MIEKTAVDNHLSEIEELKRQNEVLQQTMADFKKDMNLRLVFSELKAEAVRAGIVDVDGLKLLDLTNAHLDENNAVKGATEMIETLRVRKPWLFQAASSSPAMTAPPAQPPSQKLATEMTEAEYRAARTNLLKQYNR